MAANFFMSKATDAQIARDKYMRRLSNEEQASIIRQRMNGLNQDPGIADWQKFQKAGKDREQIEKERLHEEKLRQKERERILAEEAEAARARKILVCGDVKGSFEKLFTTVAAQVGKVGAFDALICVGSFLPDIASTQTKVCDYFSGAKNAPVNTYFIDSGPALLHAAPRGKKMGANLHYLGGYGVAEVAGLRVAFLSGCYDPDVYDTADVDFVGGAFTIKAVSELRRLVVEDRKQRGVDLLLTCGWPENLDGELAEPSQRPVDLGEGSPSWKAACSPPIAELSREIEPRYHVFGTADLFYQRLPFEAPGRKYACRCIGLGTVGSTSKQRKWLHAFQLSPMAHMKREDLRLLPSNVTPSPFAIGEQDDKGEKRTASDHPEASAAKKQRRPRLEDAADPQAVLDALSSGDLPAYCALVPRFADDVTTVVPTGTSKASSSAQGSDSAGAIGEAVEVNAESAEANVEEALSEEALAERVAAEELLKRAPKQGVVRYTFEKNGPLGIRLSKDAPPWIIEVRDFSLAAQKAPRVPLGGIVIAVNGYELGESHERCQVLIKEMQKRPVTLDVEWPLDQGRPTVNRA